MWKILVFLSFFSSVFAIIDYCDPSLCPSYQFMNHTGCKNRGNFDPVNCENTSDIKIVKLTEANKKFILDLHNQYRMIIALGIQELYPGSRDTFPAASKMMRLKWSEEQAFLASLHLKTCKSHDLCHNTAFNATTGRLIYSGQNIFYFYTYGQRYSISRYLELAAFNWFNEYQVTPLSVMDELVYPPDYYTIGHFTQMIHDKNTEIGCASAEWTEDFGDKKVNRITCNYFKSVYGGRPVYEKLPPGKENCSGCEVCDDDEFFGLCLQ